MKTVSIMQPAYLPWLGYFHRIAISDLHIVLDHVAIDRNSKTKFANRNKIRTKDGWSWLTVPLMTKGRADQLELNRIEVDNTTAWRRKHLAAIEANYSKAPFFAEHRDFLKHAFSKDWPVLIDLLRETTDYLRGSLGLETPVVYSSALGVTSQKDELILDLCRAVGATRYVSGPFGRDYLREPLFEAAGIDVKYHDYVHPTYPQMHAGFEPFMSVLDLLLMDGPASLSRLSKNQRAL